MVIISERCNMLKPIVLIWSMVLKILEMQVYKFTEKSWDNMKIFVFQNV